MKIISILFKIIVALLSALFINLAILFTIPPTTTFGIIAKDVLSLLVGGVIFFVFLRRMKK